MLCAISGQIPADPVVTPNGTVYSKSLLEKYLFEHSVDPLTKEPLDISACIPIQTKPSQRQQNNIPALLANFQSEWDSVMLECWQLKQEYTESQKQLVTALYENDAAKRVIARLLKERDELRIMLRDYEGDNKKRKVAHDDAHEESLDVSEKKDVLPSDILDLVTKTGESLSSARRGRKVGPNLATTDDISNFKLVDTVADIHSKKEPGTVSLDIESKIISGGKDGSAFILDLEGNILANQKCAKKAVVCRWLSETEFISGSEDGLIKKWAINGKKATLKATFEFGQPLLDISVHPCKSLFSCCGATKWSLYNLSTEEEIYSNTGNFTTLKFHPDGLLLGVGCFNGAMQIFDIRENQVVAELKDKEEEIRAIDFSENGYLCLSSTDQNIQFWDLRKLSLTHSLPGSKAKFDHSGKYVGIVSNDNLMIYTAKKSELIATLDVQVNDFVFLPDAKAILTAGNERKLELFSLPKE